MAACHDAQTRDSNMKRPIRLPTRPLLLGMGLVLLAACASHQDEIRDPGATTGSRPTPRRRSHLPEVVQVDETGTPAVQPAPLPARVARESQSRTRSVEGILRAESAPGSAKALMDMHGSFAPPCCIGPLPQDAERYAALDDNPVHRVAEQPVSTFSIDVDTGAYANVRRFLNAGQLPPEDAVRVEEMLNYFDYSYPAPTTRSTPFRVSTELARTPWNPDSMLLKVGIKGFEVPGRRSSAREPRVPH
jgi:Ca-activated chloride channel family protein